MTSVFLFGDMNPASTLGAVGNFYINTATKVVWSKQTGVWKSAGLLSVYIKPPAVSDSRSIGSRITGWINDLWNWIKVQDTQILALVFLVILVAIVVFMS